MPCGRNLAIEACEAVVFAFQQATHHRALSYYRPLDGSRSKPAPLSALC